ncbi:metabotropic glutamate receptor 1-like isoform X2 [Lineus longissimus]|uniref:metabotropic glutamate receptor 1-like isoform X2 n=1 Tax=Lineus longissimus TaxID=88925 RepID=UPI002B4C741E
MSAAASWTDRMAWFAWGILGMYSIGLVIGGSEKANERKVSRQDGDIIIGALFPVHRAPGFKTAFTRQCGEFWEQYGIHRIEMFYQVLDEINARDDILPEIKLGSDIRDSCWYSPIALEQSIDFIKASIASLESQHKNDTQQNISSSCQKEAEKPIAGLIGPGSSAVTIQVQNLLSLFNVPGIGYSATSKDLSDKSMYKYFLRVVPSDSLQAQVLLDIVQRYNWTYISTVYTEGNYGLSGISIFHELAESAGICTAAEDGLSDQAEGADYDKVVTNLLEFPNARAVVCFCNGMMVRHLYQAMEKRGVVGHFMIIGSDGWNVRPDVVRGIENLAAGGISIKLHSPEVKSFDEFYSKLRPKDNDRNPWFKQFWQYRFNCYIPGPDRNYTSTVPCTGEESLTSFDDYVQDAKLGFVINAIYTMAYGLDSLQRSVCNGKLGVCPELLPINGTLFLKHLRNVSFTSYSGEEVHFDAFGDPPGRYDIMNYQKILTSNGSYRYDYVQVGAWDTGNLTMNNSAIFWPKRASKVDSVCSKPCPVGQVKKIQQGRDHCCWVCTACLPNEILLDETTCRKCPKGWWPNDELTACFPIKIEYILWTDSQALIAMAFSSIGMFITLCIIVCLVRHNDTPVVKASTRELVYIILVGIIIAYATSFTLIAKPSIATCYLSRILPGFAFSMIYGALVTKTNRIARILAGSKKKIMTRKPRFMSASAQVVITCMIIGIECAVITIMLVLEPADSTMDYYQVKKVRLVCNTTTLGIIVPLGFDILLIAMCTLYAIRTRNVPENFNEAKFIGFTMYTTCVIWCAFVPIYFGSDNKVITLCIAISLSASVALVLLFFPKVYIILCKPEKNNRSAFTTSRDVRCHIGSQISAGKLSYNNSNDSMEAMRHDKAFEQAAMDIYRQKNFFDKWRTKSNNKGRVTFRGMRFGSQGSTNLYRYNPRFIKQNCAPQGSPRVKGRYESIPLRDVNESPVPTLRINSNRKNIPDIEMDLNDLNLERKRRRSRSPSPRVLPKQDSSCQTDEDLIESFYELRKRNVHKPSSSSSSQTTEDNCKSAGKGPAAAHGANGISSGRSSHNNSFYQARKDADETDSLLVHEPPGASQVSHDRHPLLKQNEAMFCSSSDEGSYSNREDSITGLDDFFYDSFIDPKDLERLGPRQAHLVDNLTLRPVDIGIHKSGSGESFKRPQELPVPSVSKRPTQDPRTGQSKSDLIIPNRYTQKGSVDNAQPQPSVSTSDIPPHINYPKRRSDITSSTASEGSDTISLGDMSDTGMKLLEEEANSVEQFQEYMRTKGIKLDLNDVQSSEV